MYNIVSLIEIMDLRCVMRILDVQWYYFIVADNGTQFFMIGFQFDRVKKKTIASRSVQKT